MDKTDDAVMVLSAVAVAGNSPILALMLRPYTINKQISACLFHLGSFMLVAEETNQAYSCEGATNRLL
jgi:hypothetical protein